MFHLIIKTTLIHLFSLNILLCLNVLIKSRHAINFIAVRRNYFDQTVNSLTFLISKGNFFITIVFRSEIKLKKMGFQDSRKFVFYKERLVCSHCFIHNSSIHFKTRTPYKSQFLHKQAFHVRTL